MNALFTNVIYSIPDPPSPPPGFSAMWYGVDVLGWHPRRIEILTAGLRTAVEEWIKCGVGRSDLVAIAECDGQRIESIFDADRVGWKEWKQC